MIGQLPGLADPGKPTGRRVSRLVESVGRSRARPGRRIIPVLKSIVACCQPGISIIGKLATYKAYTESVVALLIQSQTAGRVASRHREGQNE